MARRPGRIRPQKGACRAELAWAAEGSLARPRIAVGGVCAMPSSLPTSATGAREPAAPTWSAATSDRDHRSACARCSGFAGRGPPDGCPAAPDDRRRRHRL